MRLPASLLLLAACSGTFGDRPPRGPHARDGRAADSPVDTTDSASDSGDSASDSGDPGHSGDTALDCRWTSAEQPDDRALSTDVSGRAETTTVDGYTDLYLYDATDYLKVGVRADWGGSIVFFGLADGTEGQNASNTIDANDTGREVQIALYDPDRAMQGCAWNASCASVATSCPSSITYLGWDPVQGGNRCNNGSGVESAGQADDGALQVVTTPLHWNPDWENASCESDGCSDGALAFLESEVQLVQTMRFVRTHVVELRYAVTETAGLDHRSTYQEMPTLYTANGEAGPDLWRLFTADGAEVAIDTPAGNADGFNYENLTSPEPWVAMQDDGATYGVGILYENGVSDFQGWQLRSLPFNNVRALFPFALPAWGTVNARAYLLIGAFDTIRAEATAVLDALAPFGVLDTPADGATDTGTVTVAGWALDNRGVVTVVARIDEGTEVPLAYGARRPDVCLAWPGYPACDAVGYSGTLSLDSGCPHLVEIVATDTDGNARVIDRALVGGG